MTDRIHLVVDRSEKERFRRAAERRGMSLSEWLRKAAHEKLAAAEASNEIETRETLEGFFADCDRRETGPEPDWEAHRQVIDRSRTGGTTRT